MSKVKECKMCNGILCLSALQNKWTVFCNGCDTHIDWKDNVKKVIPLDEICSKCNTYHRVEISLKDKSQLTGCLKCEMKLKEYYYLIERKPISTFRGRGRGNNRGGRGGSSSSRGGNHSRGRGGNRGNGRGNHRGGKR